MLCKRSKLMEVEDSQAIEVLGFPELKMDTSDQPAQTDWEGVFL